MTSQFGARVAARSAARAWLPRRSVHDVVVVGSGATGGWAAKELTEAGLDVLVLEAGRGWLEETAIRTLLRVRRKAGYRVEHDARVLQRQAVQAQCYAWAGDPYAFVDDVDNPYTDRRGEVLRVAPGAAARRAPRRQGSRPVLHAPLRLRFPRREPGWSRGRLADGVLRPRALLRARRARRGHPRQPRRHRPPSRVDLRRPERVVHAFAPRREGGHRTTLARTPRRRPAHGEPAGVARGRASHGPAHAARERRGEPRRRRQGDREGERRGVRRPAHAPRARGPRQGWSCSAPRPSSRPASS